VDAEAQLRATAKREGMVGTEAPADILVGEVAALAE
jgi:hypothetical protein